MTRIGVLTSALVVVALTGCDTRHSLDPAPGWSLGVSVEGAPDAECAARVKDRRYVAQAPGSVGLPRKVESRPKRSALDTPAFERVLLSCAKEGYVSAELTLGEAPDGWIILGIKYWPGHVVDTAITRFQRTPTSVVVPMKKVN
ncbi:MAG: hypothetical protein FJX47_10865 [Alphaproteobacteria bacterium]|nr:hypothetical protein [Alphaproteobacteria bacterium]